MANHSGEALKANTHNTKPPSFLKSKTPSLERYIPKMLKFGKKKKKYVFGYMKYIKYVIVLVSVVSGVIHYLISISTANYSLPPNAL